MLFILGGTEFSICFMKNVIAVCVFLGPKILYEQEHNAELLVKNKNVSVKVKCKSLTSTTEKHLK